MSSYILDIEENFFTICEKFITDSECFEEAQDQALMLAKNMVPFMEQQEVIDGMSEMWNEYWSKYI